MFELRCSKLELFCSESAGQPPGSGPKTAMDIDPDKLPQDAAPLRQIVLQSLQVVEDKDDCWSACNTS
jgi:hypothetical protein